MMIPRPFFASRPTNSRLPALIGVWLIRAAWSVGQLLPVTAAAGAGPPSDAPSVLLANYSAGLNKKFPDVPVIRTEELPTLSPFPILLDVRNPDEFDVSRIPGARLAGGDIVGELKKEGVGPETGIVVYCSVGYRSAQVARKLAAAGYLHVRNLEGSIFQWANEGRPLVNDSGPTTGVHPFNEKWGRFLDSDRWAWKARNP